MSAAPSSAINPSALQSIIGSLTPTNLSALPGAPNSPINQFISQTNAANSANAQRGAGILNLLSGQGKAQLQLNNQNYQNQVGQIQQDAVSRGLNNTTVVPNLQQGAQNWLNTANEQVNENTAKDEANMAASFNQQAPNMSLLATLLGQGGGGGVRSNGVSTAGVPGFQQPGSMLDSASGGGGALNVNNQAMSGYNAAMQPQQSAMQNAVSAAWGNPNNAAYNLTPSMQQGAGGNDPFLGNTLPQTTGNPGTNNSPDMSIPDNPLFADPSAGNQSASLADLFNGMGGGGLAGLFS